MAQPPWLVFKVINGLKNEMPKFVMLRIVQHHEKQEQLENTEAGNLSLGNGTEAENTGLRFDIWQITDRLVPRKL
eukprot:gene848-10597_t